MIRYLHINWVANQVFNTSNSNVLGSLVLVRAGNRTRSVVYWFCWCRAREPLTLTLTLVLTTGLITIFILVISVIG